MHVLPSFGLIMSARYVNLAVTVLLALGKILLPLYNRFIVITIGI